MRDYLKVTSPQHTALQAATEGPVYDRTRGATPNRAARRCFHGNTLVALRDRGYLAEDERGGYVITPCGRRALGGEGACA